MSSQIPIVDYLVLDDGAPHLVAHECTNCGAHFFDRRNACANCSGTEFRTVDVPTDGVLRTFTIVSFAAPGIPVPFVAGVDRLRRHQRAGQRRQRRRRPRARDARNEGSAHDVFTRYRRSRHRSRGLRLRARGLTRPARRERDAMSDDVWILGIRMTKFGKHPDKDSVDLAAEATLGALADAGVVDQGHEDPRRRQPARRRRHRPVSCRSRSARPASPSTTSRTCAPPAPPRCAPR